MKERMIWSVFLLIFLLYLVALSGFLPFFDEPTDSLSAEVLEVRSSQSSLILIARVTDSKETVICQGRGMRDSGTVSGLEKGDLIQIDRWGNACRIKLLMPHNLRRQESLPESPSQSQRQQLETEGFAFDTD